MAGRNRRSGRRVAYGQFLQRSASPSSAVDERALRAQYPMKRWVIITHLRGDEALQNYGFG